MNLPVSFDSVFSHYAKPYFCLVRLEKAQGKAMKRDWFRANLRGRNPVYIPHTEVVVQVQVKAWMLARLLPFWT